jgi:APA family basic amino acid/polyamine antiporter
MSREHALWRFLAVHNRSGVPVRAIWFQSALSVFLILTGTFEQVLLYSGFVLQIFSALCVAGVFRLRLRNPEPDAYRSPFFPYIQIAYLLFSVWILVYLFIDKPRESLIGSAILVVGSLTYWISNRMESPSPDS